MLASRTANSTSGSVTVSAASGFLIEIKTDGGWSYHAPNGDIIEVRADGSWGASVTASLVDAGDSGNRPVRTAS